MNSSSSCRKVGSLYNITDEAAILRTVADYYAEVPPENVKTTPLQHAGNEAKLLTINIKSQ